jgi:hypothetical protein
MSSLEVQSASTHGEVVAIAPLLESDLELHLASTHREDVVACIGINSVAVRNFAIQLHEEAASKSSLDLQLPCNHRGSGRPGHEYKHRYSREKFCCSAL